MLLKTILPLSLALVSADQSVEDFMKAQGINNGDAAGFDDFMKAQSGSQGADPRYYLSKPNFGYWDEPSDDVLREFKNLLVFAEKDKQYADDNGRLRTLQRFAELVDMVMYLQRVPFFGQYWYYGCWCAPDGFLSAGKQGFGQPVDRIDRSCRSMSQCYECAMIDNGEECQTKDVMYKWHGFEDGDGNKQLSCDDSWDDNTRCARSICECDKKLAEDLRQHEPVWNLHNHQKWGGFNRESGCFPTKDGNARVFNPPAETVDAAASATEGGAGGSSSSSGASVTGSGLTFGEADDDWARSFGGSEGPSFQPTGPSDFGNANNKYCCGQYPSRTPLKFINDNGSVNNKQCCKDTIIFDSNTQCCSTSSIPTIEELGSSDC